MAEKIPTKFKPLFHHNYWECKQCRTSSHLYDNVFDVLFLHFNDVWQSRPKIWYHAVKNFRRKVEDLTFNREFQILQSSGCSGKIYLWSICTKIKVTWWDQATGRTNNAVSTVHPIVQNNDTLYKTFTQNAKYRFCAMQYGSVLHVEWPLTLEPRNKLGRDVPGQLYVCLDLSGSCFLWLFQQKCCMHFSSSPTLFINYLRSIFLQSILSIIILYALCMICPSQSPM